MREATRGSKRRLRILFFDHTALLSGGEIALVHLVEHLNQDLIEPIILLGAEGPLASQFRSNIDVHVLALDASVAHARKDELGTSKRVRLAALWSFLFYVFRLARFIRVHRIDIVYANSLKADILGGFASRLACTPVIWHVRDRIADDYLPPRTAKIFQWLAERIPSALIANSHATAATLPQGASSKPPVYVVHDGTPAKCSPPRFCGNQADSGDVVVGMVGRLSPWKGQDVFLRAACLIRNAYPRARFHIVGSAMFEEVEYEAALHTLVRDLHLEDVVEFRGFRKDVASEIAQMHVCVHASVRPEPFGQVIIEAMAAGIPVVATDAGGVREIVQNGVTGLLVAMGSAEELAAAVCSLLADPTKARMIAEQGRQRVKEHFSAEKTARGIEEVLQQVAAAHLRASFNSPPIRSELNT